VKLPDPSSISRRGFTLVELLIAMAITSVIMVVLLGIVTQSTDTYNRTQRAVNSLSQSRAFLQFFDREISTRLPQTPLIHQAGTGNTPDLSDKLAFVRTISIDEQSNTNPGDLGTSAYYLAYAPAIGDAVAPRLYRKVLTPAQTQVLLESPTPGIPAADPTDEAIIDNILSFQARPKLIDPASGEMKDWNINSTEPAAFIEITIRFVEESTSRRFKTKGEWDRLASSPTDDEIPLIQTFSRTIAIAK
jgi:prepilin-type N-terminal cleavage/methylation domain-containing protein